LLRGGADAADAPVFGPPLWILGYTKDGPTLLIKSEQGKRRQKDGACEQ
jgi:hypothetical protein